MGRVVSVGFPTLFFSLYWLYSLTFQESLLPNAISLIKWGLCPEHHALE